MGHTSTDIVDSLYSFCLHGRRWFIVSIDFMGLYHPDTHSVDHLTALYCILDRNRIKIIFNI